MCKGTGLGWAAVLGSSRDVPALGAGLHAACSNTAPALKTMEISSGLERARYHHVN